MPSSGANFAAAIPIPSHVWISHWRPLVTKIGELEPQCQALTDADLRKRSLALRYRARSGEPLGGLLPEAYALVREAGRRRLNMRHFDVQLLGGIALFHHAIVEMQTGEGKTLTATLPMYLYALAGRGCHLATVNDYLAKRDAEWMGPIYEALGLTVGIIQTDMSQDARRKAYAADVTYGTAKEFGFDFLRDRLLLRRIREGQVDLIGAMLTGQGMQQSEQPVQREPFFALVDEADSILIDEARTPLIISAMPTEEAKTAVECFKWAASVVDQLVEDEDYTYDHEKKSVELTRLGRRKARQLAKPDALAAVGMFHVYEYLERAIKVARDFIRDREYVVRDGEIVIVDEFTGRLGEGRKWRDGIHQAVEAKEGVEVTVATGQAARVTVQDFFLRYRHLGGMTGTGKDSSRELRRIYKCPVIIIPTNRPSIRKRLPDLIFGTEEEKWNAVVEETCQMLAQGRPVLIGTRSIEKSEFLSRLLEERSIEHQVLNAHHIEKEAAIVAEAGRKRRVTVSTNMAGRGTDIRLGPEVAELGGLHVICTEMHDAARIDWQLRGRCGRQGDPGSFRQFLSLEDELLEKGLGPKRAARLAALGRRQRRMFPDLANLFRKAQRRIERRHFRERQALMHMERERKKMQRQMGQDPYLDTPN